MQPSSDITGDAWHLADTALDSARRHAATYADIRINRYRTNFVATREERVLQISDNESYGFGVRVIIDGAWGFASSAHVSLDEVERVVLDAVTVARAAAILRSEPVNLAPTPTHIDFWRTPMEIDPFTVAVEEKVELLLAINREALRAPGARFCNSHLFSASEHKIFVSTEGSRIEQEICRVWPSFDVTAVSSDGTDFQSRSGLCMPSGQGYEYCNQYPLLDDARKAGEDAVEKLKSPAIDEGRRDLILMPSHMWLVLHESIGHATELDRALGFEANFAGTSFVTVDQLGKLQYGSEHVTVVGDRVETNGLATVGYDDEGVKTGTFDIIRDGRFVGYQTTREQAGWIGDSESHACSYADSYGHVPMQRMPNVSLMPGSKPTSLDDLIGGIDRGVLIEGAGSWSIDQQRHNFQFGGQIFREIRNGRITNMLRDVAFQSTTVEFWNSCDAVCSQDLYELGGSYFCGKAQPEQVAPVSHGSAPT
ncbi:MAG: TldD/PmbA family protein, partial [bacterium]|nr:TldD/PmbA family protein [Candidatus Kapabacteria bacterium]